MKILYRIMDIFCHPSRIVFYYKDKAYVVIIHLLAFISLAIGVTAAMAYSGYYVTRSDGEAFSKVIFESSKTANVEYSDYKMSGDEATVSAGVFRLYFNTDVPKQYSNSEFVVVFGSEKAKGYLGTKVIYESNYKDLKENYNFKLSDLKDGKNEKEIDFVDFISVYLRSFEHEYATQKFIGGCLTIAEFYGILLLALFIFTYLINPTIKFDVRVRLMIYDSLVFFFVFSLAFIFNVEFLEYLAFALALFYSSITFRHIVRINKNGK
ncbi:MAG: hypothetical protein K6F81_03500 [Acholeplasmatales bacterium]|nr:hypothetical protein [Acholeplasmatales bacterium]